MRIETIVSVIGVVLIACGCSKTPEGKLIGEWKSTDSGHEAYSFLFNRDRTVRFIMGGVVLDGPTVGGKVEWRIDTTRDPISLDLVVTPESGQQRVLPMIIRFITDQKLQLKTSPDFQSRPTGFSAKDTENQQILVKQ